MSWNKRIKDLRIDHDMGKKELADKLDISERTLLLAMNQVSVNQQLVF